MAAGGGDRGACASIETFLRGNGNERVRGEQGNRARTGVMTVPHVDRRGTPCTCWMRLPVDRPGTGGGQVSGPKCPTVLQGRCHIRCLEGGNTHFASAPTAAGTHSRCATILRAQTTSNVHRKDGW